MVISRSMKSRDSVAFTTSNSDVATNAGFFILLQREPKIQSTLEGLSEKAFTLDLPHGFHV